MCKQNYNLKKKKTTTKFKNVSLWNATKTQTQRITTNVKDTNLLQERKKIKANFKNIMNPNVTKLTQTQMKKKQKTTS
jgi:hypothetical protein